MSFIAAHGSLQDQTFIKEAFGEKRSYASFASEFTARFYDPAAWAYLFEAAGAKYVVMTAKHHEGFANWPSTFSSRWSTWDQGPMIDLIGMNGKVAYDEYPNCVPGAMKNELAQRPSGLKFGLYYSFYEWFNGLYDQDKSGNFSLRNFPATKAIPELKELVWWCRNYLLPRKEEKQVFAGQKVLAQFTLG